MVLVVSLSVTKIVNEYIETPQARSQLWDRAGMGPHEWSVLYPQEIHKN